METVIRISVIYLFILIALRMLGKREFGQLSPFELVTLLLIPEIVQQSMMGKDFSLTNGLVGLSTLFTLVFLTSVVSHRSRRAERWIEGTPTILVNRGRMVPKSMNRTRVTPEELHVAMHEHGLVRLADVAWAILEADGKISIIPEQAGSDAPEARESAV